MTTTNTEYHHHIPQSTKNSEFHYYIPRSVPNTEYRHYIPQSRSNAEYQNYIPQSTINTESNYHIPQSIPNSEHHYYTPQSKSNAEYQHYIPPPTLNTRRLSNSVQVNTKKIHEISDDDDQLNEPVSLTTTSNHQRNKIQQVDSGIEYDQTSPPPSTSSSTIFNQRCVNNNNNNKRLLFPPVTASSGFDDRSKSTLVRRLNSTKAKITNSNDIQANAITNSCWNLLKKIWLRSLLLGLLILFVLFFMYLSLLDTCSRSTIIRTVSRQIICVEHKGLPTI